MTPNIFCSVIQSYKQSLLYPDGLLISVDQLFAAVYDSMLVLNTDARLAAIVASWLFIFGTFNFLFPNMIKRLSWRKVRSTLYTILRVLGPLVLFYYVWIPMNRLLYWILSQRKIFNLPISCQWLPFFSLMFGLAWFTASCNYLADSKRKSRPWMCMIASVIGRCTKGWCPTRLRDFFSSTKCSASGSEIEESLEIEEFPDESPKRRSKSRVRYKSERELERDMRRRRRYVKKLAIPAEAFDRPPRNVPSPSRSKNRSKHIKTEFYENNDEDGRIYKSGRKVVYKRTTKTPPRPKKTRTGKVYGQ